MGYGGSEYPEPTVLKSELAQYHSTREGPVRLCIDLRCVYVSLFITLLTMCMDLRHQISALIVGVKINIVHCTHPIWLLVIFSPHDSQLEQEVFCSYLLQFLLSIGCSDFTRLLIHSLLTIFSFISSIARYMCPVSLGRSGNQSLQCMM